VASLVNIHPADVIALVWKRGTSLSALARANKMASSSFNRCLRKPIPTANRAIAAFLGQKPQELWPDWFDQDGNRRDRRRADIHKALEGERQKSALHTDRRSAA